MTTSDGVSFGKEFVEQFRNDDASGMAAELAYRWLFAVFPFGLFLAALGAFVAAALGIQNPAQQVIDGLGDNFPAGLASTIQPELERVIGQQRPGLASVGALAALWAATSGTMTLIKAMNRAYGVDENRSALRKYGIGIGLTVAGAAGLIVAFVTIVGGALLTEELARQLGVGGVAWTVITLARWPIAFVLLVAAVSVFLRIGPNMTPSWRSSLAGAAVFAVGWLIATFVFALYVSNFSNYGATYGALAGVIVLMLWFYVTAMVLVAAGELVALLTKRTEPERLEERREAIRANLELSKSAGSIRKRLAGVLSGLKAGAATGAARGRASAPAEPSPVSTAAHASPTDGRPAGAAPVTALVALPDYMQPRPAQPIRTRQRADEVPARFVAVAAAAAALGVALLTSRLPRR